MASARLVNPLMKYTARVVVSLMLIGMAIPLLPPAAADTACPAGALACCTVGTTCSVGANACSLGTTKFVHVHAGVGGEASIQMTCAFAGETSFEAVSCSSVGTGECANAATNSLGGNMRCIKTNVGGPGGYCAIFP